MQMQESCTQLFIIKKKIINIISIYQNLLDLGALIILMVDFMPAKQMLEVDPLD